MSIVFIQVYEALVGHLCRAVHFADLFVISFVKCDQIWWNLWHSLLTEAFLLGRMLDAEICPFFDRSRKDILEDLNFQQDDLFRHSVYNLDWILKSIEISMLFCF